jgi:crotonobetainyl-CoA:carnitine CoA-transferase CaiB-like acyl-CoA transferase
MLRRVIQFSTAARRQATRATIGLRPEVAATGAHNRSVLADFGYNENAIAAVQGSGASRERTG